MPVAVVPATIACHSRTSWGIPTCFSDVDESKIFPYEISFPAMGSVFTMRWFDQQSKNHEQSLELARDLQSRAKLEMERWNMILSDYEEESEIMQLIEKGEDRWHSVSEGLAKVLTVCDDWNAKSEQAFDAALGAISKLRRRRRLATPAEWELAKKSSGWRHVEWDRSGQRVRWNARGLRFDFGAVGKGWVADEIYALIVDAGLPVCSVDFSGNMRFGAPPPEREGWPVTIQSCEPVSQVLEIRRLRLSECGIATSGDRWQKFHDSRSVTIQDRTSHIVDPATGTGMDIVHSATIVAPNAMLADVASTATSVWQTRNLSVWLNKLQRDEPHMSWFLQHYHENAVRVRSNLG